MKREINMLEKLPLIQECFNDDEQLTIGEIILKRLEGIEDFNHDKFQLSWKIIVTKGD
jgi:hypothetical protein